MITTVNNIRERKHKYIVLATTDRLFNDKLYTYVYYNIIMANNLLNVV